MRIAYFPSLLDVLEIQFVQRLDMVACERDRHEHHLLLPKSGETLDCLARLHAHPRRRPNLGLPDKPIRIRVAEAVHDCGDCSRHLENVGVAAVHYGHRKRVRGEEQNRLRALLSGELRQRTLDVLRDRLYAAC